MLCLLYTSFGTGNHETTYLMISEMLKLDLEGKELLDIGCGTAVLAILARLKGAKRVAAIDIDEWAYNNALENIRLNHTEDIQVALGGAEKIKEFGLFDIVFANINRKDVYKRQGGHRIAHTAPLRQPCLIKQEPLFVYIGIRDFLHPAKTLERA